ncbi:MAG: hypothetical protein OHK0053_15790 [Microscillaceae bacterium]
MKKQRIIIIITASALAMVGLVIMQITWIRHAAQLRESQLKHRVTMASYRIAYRLSKDSLLVEAIAQQLEGHQTRHLQVPIALPEKERINQLLQAEFRYHHINLDYTFAIVDKNHPQYAGTCETSLKAHSLCLDRVLKPERTELRVSFLNPQQYVFSQMWGMLGASFLFIVVLAAGFVMTIQTVLRQKKLSEMTTDFINNMTHELKTPISTISLASNMLRREPILAKPEKIIHYSSMIHEENQKLQEQVEQVLRIAKLEKGDIQLEKSPVSVHEIVKKALSSIDLQVRERNGQIRCYLNALRHEIMADVNHLTNVISNLLDNANKYSPEKPEITISTHDREDGVVISVEDKGIGMSKDKQKHIFDKFYRVPTGNIHDVKGFGLGLAYVKMMVDAHKGQIYLASEPGKGSRFDLFLPYQ